MLNCAAGASLNQDAHRHLSGVSMNGAVRLGHQIEPHHPNFGLSVLVEEVIVGYQDIAHGSGTWRVLGLMVDSKFVSSPRPVPAALAASPLLACAASSLRVFGS